MDKSINKAIIDTSGWLGKQVNKARIEMEKYNMPISDFIELKAAKEQVITLTAQVEAMHDALDRLVELKDHKDEYGKDDFYVHNQHLAWRQARETLSSLDTKCPKHETGGGPCYCKPAQGGGE